MKVLSREKAASKPPRQSRLSLVYWLIQDRSIRFTPMSRVM
jgi:hypothetical protein